MNPSEQPSLSDIVRKYRAQWTQYGPEAFLWESVAAQADPSSQPLYTQEIRDTAQSLTAQGKLENFITAVSPTTIGAMFSQFHANLQREEMEGRDSIALPHGTRTLPIGQARSALLQMQQQVEPAFDAKALRIAQLQEQIRNLGTTPQEVLRLTALSKVGIKAVDTVKEARNQRDTKIWGFPVSDDVEANVNMRIHGSDYSKNKTYHHADLYNIFRNITSPISEINHGQKFAIKQQLLQEMESYGVAPEVVIQHKQGKFEQQITKEREKIQKILAKAIDKESVGKCISEYSAKEWNLAQSSGSERAYSDTEGWVYLFPKNMEKGWEYKSYRKAGKLCASLLSMYTNEERQVGELVNALDDTQAMLLAVKEEAGRQKTPQKTGVRSERASSSMLPSGQVDSQTPLTTQPAHLDANQLVLKRQWDARMRTARGAQALTLLPSDVELLKNAPPSSWDTSGITTVTMRGCDLRSVYDLGDRLGAFHDLQKLDLRNCKIDTLNADALPPNVTIDLRGSVVPLPLQETLGDHVLLSPRPEQIRSYKGGSLQEWSGRGETDEMRRDANRGIGNYLDGATVSPALSGLGLREFDDDFYAMIADKRLKELNLSGNRLGLGNQSVDRLALSPNLEEVNLSENQFSRLPDGLEYAPDRSEVDLTANPLSDFAKIDAKLINFARLSGLQATLGARRRAQIGGPTVTTDPIVGDEASLRSFEWPANVLGDLDEQGASVQAVELELQKMREETSSRGDIKDLEKHEQRWREVQDTFTRQAYVNALESVITNQGGPFKSGRMQAYHHSAELGASVACNRSLALHQLPGQPDVQSGTAPGLKTPKYAAKGIVGLGKLIPAFGGAVEGSAQAVSMGIDFESARRFDAFHNNLAKIFRPSELQTLGRVLPLAMTLTMGEQLESPASVNVGNPRENDPAQTLIDLLTRAVIKETSTPEEKRAFRDVAYLMADIASGAAYGVPNNPAALKEKLGGMPFEQKVNDALQYWANGRNAAGETLPFKSRYVLCDSPLFQQLETIARNYTLNDLDQGRRIRSLEGHVDVLENQLNEERDKRHQEKRSRRATTQQLVNAGLPLDPPSPWESETEDDHRWWADKFSGGARLPGPGRRALPAPASDTHYTVPQTSRGSGAGPSTPRQSGFGRGAQGTGNEGR